MSLAIAITKCPLAVWPGPAHLQGAGPEEPNYGLKSPKVMTKSRLVALIQQEHNKYWCKTCKRHSGCAFLAVMAFLLTSRITERVDSRVPRSMEAGYRGHRNRNPPGYFPNSCGATRHRCNTGGYFLAIQSSIATSRNGRPPLQLNGL